VAPWQPPGTVRLAADLLGAGHGDDGYRPPQGRLAQATAAAAAGAALALSWDGCQ